MTEKTVAVIGAGTIGLGWTVLLLARGVRVRLNSRRADAGQLAADAVDLFHPTVRGDKLDVADALALLEIRPDRADAVSDVDVVLENTPDKLELKQALFAEIEPHLADGALLLSSTSRLLPADMGASMADRSRLVVGHPFNPPHLIPLVEVVPDEHTDPDAVSRAVDFYRGLGQSPVVLRKAVPGFAANRLQAALLRESIHLVREGVLDMAELDEVVTQSVGLRWATVGPFQAFHLGGGPGGLRKWLTSVAPSMPRTWAGLGTPALDPSTVDELSAEAERLFGADGSERLSARRDHRQKAILDVLTESDSSPAPPVRPILQALPANGADDL
jgi:ketoreductase RED1